MPPKKTIVVQPATRRTQATPPGYLSSIYKTLTSEENSSVVISVAMFGAAVAFFASEWSEILHPAL